MRVTDECAKLIVNLPVSPHEPLLFGYPMRDLAADLLDARAALRAVCDNAEAIAVRMNKMAIDQGCDCQDSCICGFPDTLRELAAFKCALAAARKQMGEK